MSNPDILYGNKKTPLKINKIIILKILTRPDFKNANFRETKLELMQATKSY